MRNYGYGYGRKSKSSFKSLVMTLILLIFIIGISLGAYKLFSIPAPVVEGTEAFELLSMNKKVLLKGKNIKSIDIYIYQGEKKIELLKDMPESIERKYVLQINPRDLELKDGSAKVIVKARSGILKDVKYEIKATIDTIPPTIEVIRAPSIINQGSGGLALLKSKNADSVFVKLVDSPGQSGSEAENKIFTAFKAPPKPESSTRSQGPGYSGQTSNTYFVFFPAPFDIKDSSVFYAVAKDTAGNQSVRALPTRLKIKKYRTSSINVTDSFIKTVVSPLLNKTSISNPADDFKKVNEDWRDANTKKLVEIARETSPEILWKGRFLQLRNTKVMATYGDKRTYFYKERPISKSAHLGYDLASTKNATVEAANSGIVRFAGDLGIYGKTLIIDHGLGLMSLYGHLSMIMVNEGQEVIKGQGVAKTGSSGLAGGDHLHFGILIHGYEVSPLYWWDRHWIKVNVQDYLEQEVHL